MKSKLREERTRVWRAHVRCGGSDQARMSIYSLVPDTNKEQNRNVFHKKTHNATSYSASLKCQQLWKGEPWLRFDASWMLVSWNSDTHGLHASTSSQLLQTHTHIHTRQFEPDGRFGVDSRDRESATYFLLNLHRRISRICPDVFIIWSYNNLFCGFQFLLW